MSYTSSELKARIAGLKMPLECLAECSEVSVERITQILSSNATVVLGQDVCNILDVLGLPEDTAIEAGEFRRHAARRKAFKLTSLVQGSCQLEGQGVDAKTFNEMVEDTAEKLLNDPDGRRLWTPL